MTMVEIKLKNLKFKTEINRDILWLSLVFLFIFFGFNAVQQYVTAFFSEVGIANQGRF